MAPMRSFCTVKGEKREQSQHQYRLKYCQIRAPSTTSPCKDAEECQCKL
jgi:hypothetical protein